MFKDIKKLKLDGNTPYSVDTYGKMRHGCMTTCAYKLGSGVTMLLVCEGIEADEKLDAALSHLQKEGSTAETDLQVRICALAMASRRAKTAKQAFAKKFSQALDEQVTEYLKNNPKEAENELGAEYARSLVYDKMQKRGELSEWREDAFNQCLDEWQAMKEANKKLGAIKSGLIRTGKKLLNMPND